MKKNSQTQSSFRLSALAVGFMLVMAVTWPSTFIYADDSSTTPDTTTTTTDTSTPPPDTTITTGDAVSTGDSQNDTNTNTTSTTGGNVSTLPDGTTLPDSSSTTPDLNSTGDASTTPGGDATIADTNAATTTSTTTADAETGTNSAGGGSGNATISTGDAFASANSVNLVNTNIIDSAGLLAFANLFSAWGIDLRNLDLSYFTGSGSATDCSLTTCPGDLTVTNTNNATTTSTVSVVANTGDNTASSTGDSTIYTGNAYASGNSVNIVNSNIIRSNYLLVGINDFGDLLGDITLPSASFFNQLLSHDHGVGNHTRVSNDNTAVVTSGTSASANTGNNDATGGAGGSTVVTGDALSSATSLNQVNTNQVGGNKIFFLFRIWGGFSGNVQGLPPGMQWKETSDGLVITNQDGTLGGLDSLPGGNIDASSTNNANVASNVSVYALTGNNEAQSSAGTSTISTGNAYAAANSVNIVNTNLIGTNWIYAIFNIFGNLNGNIAFGHPDLWLGASAETGNPTLPGSDVAFHFTVANRGDADATHVKLSADFLDQMLNFNTGSSTTDGQSWDLGTIPAGSAQDFTYDASAGFVPQGGSIAVPVTATLTSDETDNNPTDNTDNLNIVVTNPGGGVQGGTDSFTSDPKISITKSADVFATTTPASVDYTVDITNDGGPAYGAVATDVLTDPTGNVVHTQSWNLDTINYQDEVEITYTTQFDNKTLPGTYTNTVTVNGSMHYPDGPASVPMVPVSATKSILLLPSGGSPVCEAYLTSYLRPGGQNDPDQVKKLQEFLRDTEGESTVSVTGVYDAATIAGVKQFQEKYADKILSPWGYDKPTGLVYYTTQVQINDIACGGERTFGLSDSQRAEIDSTHGLIANLRNAFMNAVSAPAPSEAATTTATSSGEFILPAGIDVGVAPAPTKAPKKGSWFSQMLGVQRAMMANVLNALSSAVNVVAVNQ